jgi:hypothetical protein
MLFNEDYSVESVKAIVAEFLTKGSYDREECTITVDEKPYVSGSYAHPVMEGVWMYYCGIGCPSWTIKDCRCDKPVYYDLRPNRSTKSILWACEVVKDELNTCSMMVIAPTRRMAELEAQNGLFAGAWGPRRVKSVTPLSRVDCCTIPSWMK